MLWPSWLEDYDFPWLGISAIIGDVAFVCPARWTVQAHVSHNRRAYHYHFTHVTVAGELYRIGAFHGSEIPFVFDSFGIFHPTDDERELSRIMRDYWLSFAMTGEPMSLDGVDWPAYDLVEDSSLELSTIDMAMRMGWGADTCAFWKDVLGLN
ncbi:MAG: carboxylesterase family protein [Bradymonadaceae bacterium]